MLLAAEKEREKERCEVEKCIPRRSLVPFMFAERIARRRNSASVALVLEIYFVQIIYDFTINITARSIDNDE